MLCQCLSHHTVKAHRKHGSIAPHAVDLSISWLHALASLLSRKEQQVFDGWATKKDFAFGKEEKSDKLIEQELEWCEGIHKLHLCPSLFSCLSVFVGKISFVLQDEGLQTWFIFNGPHLNALYLWLSPVGKSPCYTVPRLQRRKVFGTLF
jgi:hypothetical protein